MSRIVVESAPRPQKRSHVANDQPPVAWVDGGPLQVRTAAPRDLARTLEHAAASFPRQGIVYVQGDGSDRFQSYPELMSEARRVLGGLQAIGLQPGQIVILQLPQASDFIPAFWACVLGGFIPAPLAVPCDHKHSSGALVKLQKSCELVERAVLLADERRVPDLQEWIRGITSAQLELAVYEVLRQAHPSSSFRKNDAAETALLMLTSGSTGFPKGVPLTHANLISRSAASVQMNQFTSDDVALNWMPLDHVAGLIYFHLRDVFLGCTEVQVPTSFILHDPLRWLDGIERFRATITFAPNFAYGLVNERAAEVTRRHWDLSSMRYILNGAEAIVSRTARRFLQLLMPHGLPGDAMHPAWGMSETSSGVTYSDRFQLELTSDDDAFVEVGAPIPGFSIRIVDSNDQVLEEGAIGRLQVKGCTVMQGYYKNPELNRTAFTFDGWFKTGDLGLIRAGRLTITGREKDVIIINSVNYYSHEIEGVVEQLPGIEPSFTAACGVRTPTHDTERLAIFFSPARAEEAQWPALIQEIRLQVLRQIGVNPDFILPVQKKDVPKTEIGKIQRARLKAEFEAGAFDQICHRWNSTAWTDKPPRNDLERQIARIWEEVMRISPVGIDRNFFEMGGDSLRATRILSRLREAFQVELTLRDFFEETPTVESMTQRVAGRQSEGVANVEVIRRRQEDEPVPLSYAQQRIWFLDQMNPGSALFNIPILIQLRGPVNESALRTSLEDLARRHEILRTTFPLKRLGPQQVIHAKAACEFKVISVEDSCPESVLMREALQSLDLLNGPVWRARFLRASEDESHLLLLFHQIVIDGWSLEILFREIKEAYLAALGRPDSRERLSMQCADFALWQRHESTVARMEKSVEYWTGQLASPMPTLNLKPDFPGRPGHSHQGAVVSKMLNSEAVAELLHKSQHEAVSAFTVFLTLFFVVLRHRTGETDLRLGTAVSGRQHLEIEKLIGFFVNTLVLRLSLKGNPTFQHILRMLRNSVLEGYAHQDAPFEEVVNKVRPRRSGVQHPLIQVWFGLQDPMNSFKAGDVVFEPSKLDIPFTQFELSLFIREEQGRFWAILEYSTDLFQAGTARLLSEQYAELLNFVSRDPHADLQTMLALLDKIESQNRRSQPLTRAEPSWTRVTPSASTPPQLVR